MNGEVARSMYVSMVRRIRDLARRAGIMDPLEDADNPLSRHIRTLFAIYDAEDLASLDLPWWAYRSIEAVEAFLAQTDRPRVFEFGSGASTVWLSRRATEVHSVEHDPAFADTVRGLLSSRDNVTLHVVPPSPVRGVPQVRSQRRGYENLDFADYASTIQRVGGLFDLVVVDGRARLDSLRYALPQLAPSGLIVFDDIGRRRYRPALEARGLVTEVLTGATPCVPYPTSTGLLRRSDQGRGPFASETEWG